MLTARSQRISAVVGESPRIRLRYPDGYTRPIIVNTHLQITGLWPVIKHDIKKLLLYTEFRMQVFWHDRGIVNTERIQRQKVRIALESRQAEAQSCCTARVTNVGIYRNEETSKHSLEYLLEALEQTV